MLYIILDTNFLMAPTMFKVDIFRAVEQLKDEYGSIRLLTLSSCIDELRSLAEGGNRNANSALLLAKKIRILRSSGKGDKAIVSCAKRMKAEGKNIAVATADRNLIKALSKNKIKIIRLRQKKYLVVE